MFFSFFFFRPSFSEGPVGANGLVDSAASRLLLLEFRGSFSGPLVFLFFVLALFENVCLAGGGRRLHWRSVVRRQRDEEVTACAKGNCGRNGTRLQWLAVTLVQEVRRVVHGRWRR